MEQTNNPQEIVAEAKSPTELKQIQLERSKTIWKYTGLVALLLLTVCCFARVPYVGSYIDGLFDYIFGASKFVFYPLAIFVLVSFIFGLRTTKVIKSKRFIVFTLLGILSVGCILSGVYDILHFFGQSKSFGSWMSEYHNAWWSYFNNISYQSFINSFISGGILAVLISYAFNFMSYVVLVVIAALILVLCIFIIFNINYKSTKVGMKLRGWMVKKLGGSFKYDGFNELKHSKANQNKFKKIAKQDIEKIARTSDTIPLELLPDTDIDNRNPNFKQALKLQHKLETLFRNNEIDCIAGDTDVYASYFSISFEAKTKKDLNAIIDLQQAISEVTHLDKFNLTYRGNIINIEAANPYFSKISLRTVSGLLENQKKLSSFFGLNKESKLAHQDFKYNPSALIVGKRGSGSATLAVSMAISTCYMTSPKELELDVLNPLSEITYSGLNQLPHTRNKSYESLDMVTEKLHDLQTTLDERNSLLKVNGVNNIDQYNKVINNVNLQFKHILVLIPNFEACIKDTFQNNKIIADLITNGPKVGIYVILQSYNVTNEMLDDNIYKNVNEKYFFALETESESLKVFNSLRAYQLYTPGDCLHFSFDKIRGMDRLQICNLGQSEMLFDIDIIKTFWNQKTEQKIEVNTYENI